MAIDLNRPIGKARDAGNELPSKRHMNLAGQAQAEGGIKRVHVLLGVLGLVVVLAVAKFCVVDPLMATASAEQELAAQKRVQTELDKTLENYDSVEREYQSYVSADLTSNVDALAVLDMVERNVMPTASVAQVQLDGNVLTLVLADADLDTVGRLTNTLNDQESVATVSVTRSRTSEDVASKGASSDVITKLIVTFAGFESTDSSNGSGEAQTTAIAGGTAVATTTTK